MSNYNNNKHRHRFSLPKEQTINFGLDDEEQLIEEPAVGEEPAMPTKETPVSGFVFISFGSGSSGNCAYVGNEDGGVLVDAGVDVDQVMNTLLHNGVRPSMIKGIILTHDHQDHVRYVYTFVRRFKHLRVHCTPRLLNGLLRRHNISRRIKEFQENIFKEIPFKLGGLSLTAFETSHDGTDNMGFDIESGGKHFVVAPDMGVITPRAHHYMSKANFLTVECNYDLQMLNNGTYPEYLKNRVRGERGHLDNEVVARFLAENYHEGLKYVFMNHLSKDNNTPEIARNTIVKALNERGLTVGDASNEPDQRDRDIQLYALPRFDASLWFIL